MPTVSLIANKRAGAGLDRARRADLMGLFEQAGLTVKRRPRGSIARQIRRAQREPSDIVVVAGGDGTLNAVASAFEGSRRPIGLVPFGTMNLMALDLGLPRDPLAAIRAIAGGRPTPVSGGRLDGHVFLHSALLGFPTRLGRFRERSRGSFHLWRKIHFMWHGLTTLGRDTPVTVGAQPPSSAPLATARGLLIAVGDPDWGRHLMFHRASVTADHLTVYALETDGAMATLRVIARGMFSDVEGDPDVSVARGPAFSLSSGRTRLQALLDGERRLIHGTATVEIVPRVVDMIVPR